MDHFFNFDWRTYLSLYPEVPVPGCGKGIFAFRHWLAHGRREGRYFPRKKDPELFPEDRQVERKRFSGKLHHTPVPVVICIDVEPDEHMFQPGNPPGWSGARTALDLFQELRPGLREKTGNEVKYGWFWRLDPQIGIALDRPEHLLERFGEDVCRLGNVGDEMALHVHCFRYDRHRRTWVLDYADREWVEECVESAVDAFQNHFGRRPLSHRFGDRWLDGNALELLRRLGIRHDLTLEPDLALPPASGHTLGSFPDMKGVPTGPFAWNGRSIHDPPDREVSSALWLIPLTTGRSKSTGSTVFTLNLALEPRLFRQIVNTALESRNLPLLVSVLSTKSMTHPFVAGVVRKNLHFLGGHFAARTFCFVSPSDTLDLLTGENGRTLHQP